MLTAGIATSQLRVTALSYGTATTMMTKGGGLPWTVMADAAATAVDLILARRAWAVVAPKETILPYRTMTLPAAAGTTTTRRHRCGVVGGRPTEEGVDIIAGTMTTQRRGGTSSPERRRRGGGGAHHRWNDDTRRKGWTSSPERQRRWIPTRPPSRRVRRLPRVPPQSHYIGNTQSPGWIGVSLRHHE